MPAVGGQGPEVETQNYPAIALIGPTASGKSTLGTALAERFHGEIVTCDALQVYRYMDIGTAKPGADERSRVPHHMLDLRDPCDDFSAGDYLRLGREALSAVRARNRIPIVVGGTGFYLRALLEGLFEGPGRCKELRQRMRSAVARRGPEVIHRALRRVDPAAAARLAPADAERNIRAYEIYLLTGQPMSWWQSQPKDSLEGFRWLKLGTPLAPCAALRPDRPARRRDVPARFRCGSTGADDQIPPGLPRLQSHRLPASRRSSRGQMQPGRGDRRDATREPPLCEETDDLVPL